MFLRPNTYGAGTGVAYNPEYLKLLWDRLTREAGVEVLLHTQLVDLEASASAPRLVLRTPGGLARLAARRVIDCSGDAHAARLLGAELEEAGTREVAQTFTTTFRMCNVDLDAFARAGGKAMLKDRMAEAVDRDTYALPRREGSVHPMVQPNAIATVAVRVPFASPFDAHAITAAEQEGRRQAFLYEDFLRAEVHGFADAKIIGMSAPQIGIRESRRLVGDYRLVREDCLGEARFEDAVMLCGAPIEDHRAGRDGADETEWVYIPNGGVYQVPYRCFTAPGHDALWVAGRCFSATHSAQASCRSMAQTMSMGQAAGAAAALSLTHDYAAQDVPAAALQADLRALGTVLEPPTRIAHTGRDAWFANRPAGEGAYGVL